MLQSLLGYPITEDLKRYRFPFRSLCLEFKLHKMKGESMKQRIVETETKPRNFTNEEASTVKFWYPLHKKRCVGLKKWYKHLLTTDLFKAQKLSVTIPEGFASLRWRQRYFVFLKRTEYVKIMIWSYELFPGI